VTDYSKMSDEQINTAVAMALGEKAGEPVNGMQLIAVDGEYLSSSFDPCNSWADAGPILFKNGIGIGIYGYGEWGASNTSHTYVHGTNPLRAAMIVFLMMNEGE